MVSPEISWVGRGSDVEQHEHPGVASYVRAAVSENTRRAYRSDLEHFLDWGGSLPATDIMVARYLADHAGC